MDSVRGVHITGDASRVAVTLHFGEPDVEFISQHYAFLVDDEKFDVVLARIQSLGVEYWADPFKKLPGQINTNDGGRGF